MAKNGPISELIASLNQNADCRIIVQSIHVSPGHEFHQVVRECLLSGCKIGIGMPLLTSQDDHYRVARALLPLIHSHRHDGVIIFGHGTSHPSWTVLPAFEKIVRTVSGEQVIVAALEKFPSSEDVIAELKQNKCSKLLAIPLLITAGMHFHRDITGNSDKSWTNRLAKESIALLLHDQGLGLLDGIPEIFCDHIEEALKSLTN
jgi:sirohydrochlorin cobaltochelatase